MQRQTDWRKDRWWLAAVTVVSIAALLVVGGSPASAQGPEPRRVSCEPLLPDTVRPGDLFACALDAAPGLLVIGSVRDDLRARDAGSVYVFEDDAPPLRLAPENLGATDRFGYAVDADRGGGRFVASAPFHDAAGAAYLFRLGHAGWAPVARLTASDGAAGDGFGASLAMAGGVLLVGAPFRDDGAR